MPIDASFVSGLFLFGLFFGLLFVFLGYVTYYLGTKKAVNRFVGFRIPPTFRNPEVWMKTNTRIGLLAILHGLFLIGFGLILPLVYNPFFLLIVLLLPLAIYLTYGIWYAYHLENQFKRNIPKCTT